MLYQWRTNMKYIDAELLRKEIEFAKTVYEHPNRVVHGVADAFMQDGRAAMCADILKKIDSLQQEQPDCHTVEDWIGYIKNADQLTKDIFSKGPYDVLYDALNHPYQHCYDAIKEFGELCFQTGVDSVKQEQPSLPDNLDKAAEVYASKYPAYNDEQAIAEYAFKAGAQWMKDQLTVK